MTSWTKFFQADFASDFSGVLYFNYVQGCRQKIVLIPVIFNFAIYFGFERLNSRIFISNGVY